MSDAPERIWTCAHMGECGEYYASAVEAEGENGGYAVEYVRADVYDRAIKTARLFAKCNDKGTRQKMREELEGILAEGDG